jgi:hypothetical protein
MATLQLGQSARGPFRCDEIARAARWNDRSI